MLLRFNHCLIVLRLVLQVREGKIRLGDVGLISGHHRGCAIVDHAEELVFV